jgi:hypothetical protein
MGLASPADSEPLVSSAPPLPSILPASLQLPHVLGQLLLDMLL